MLFLSAIATSMDSFLIGFSLKNTHKLTMNDLIVLWFGYIFTLYIILKIFSLFQIQIDQPIFKCIVFFILGILCLKEQKEEYQISIKKRTLFFLTLTNSLDGCIVALTFTKTYPLLYISFLFSSFSIILLWLGYKFSKQKKNRWLSPFLYFSLAILSFF